MKKLCRITDPINNLSNERSGTDLLFPKIDLWIAWYISTQCGMVLPHTNYTMKPVDGILRTVWFGLLELNVFVTVTDISRPCQPKKLIPLLP